MAKLKYIGILLLCACMAVQPITAYAAAEKISVDTSASRSAKKEVKKAEKKLIKDKDSKKEVKKKIQNTEKRMNQLSERLDSLSEEWLKMDKERKERQEDMKLRIQYMYENGNTGILSLLLSGSSTSSVLNDADSAVSLAEYDRKKLDEYAGILQDLKNSQDKIDEDIHEMQNLQDELHRLKNSLSEKIIKDKKSLSAAEKKLQKAEEEENKQREEKRKQIEEERKREAEAAAAVSMQSMASVSGVSPSIPLQYSAVYNTGAQRLTRRAGVVYYNGHRETYYSQQVLPGGGLSIPGRHVAQDGTIRDGDGYICVAAALNFMPRGSTLMTSLGPAKVYDTGCAYGTIDIYVNW